MRTILTAVLLVLPLVARAELKAELSLVEKGNRLWARVTLSGIDGCPTSGSVTVVWTSPDESVYRSSQYEAPYRACSAAGGMARTSAYRTVRGVKWEGRALKPAVGTWKVRIVGPDKAVLATGSYEVR